MQRELHTLVHHRGLRIRRDRGTSEVSLHISSPHRANFFELYEFPTGWLQYLHLYSNQNNRALLLEHLRARLQVRDMRDYLIKFLGFHVQHEALQRFQEVVQNQYVLFYFLNVRDLLVVQ